MIIITIHRRSLRFFETVTQLVSSDNRQSYLRADYKISLKGWHTSQKDLLKKWILLDIRFDIQMKPIGAMRIGRCVRVGESRTIRPVAAGSTRCVARTWGVYKPAGLLLRLQPSSIHFYTSSAVCRIFIVGFSLCCDSIPISLKWAHPAKVSSVFGCTGWAKKSGRWRILITPIEKYV
jgi:hypothetical protein